MPTNSPASGRQGGLTLIEMMVAMTLSLLVTGVAVGVFVNASRNFSQDEAIGRMQENARYALRMLADDLSLAGFWGEYLDVGAIALSSTTLQTFYNGLSIAGADDCGSGTNWALTPIPTIEILDNATASAINSARPCIAADEVADAAGAYPMNTTVMAIKHVAGRSKAADRVEAGDDNKIFMRTNNVTAQLVQYDHSSPGPADFFDWELATNVYYISNNSFKDYIAGVAGGKGCEEDFVPTLYRKKLQFLGSADRCSTKSGLVMDDDRGGVAQGIEDFRILWGIDGDQNGIPEQYQATWTSDAVTAQVHVLARTQIADCAYEHTRSHTLGGVTLPASLFVVPGTMAGNALYCGRAAGEPDPYHRRVFTTTVRLRNPANMNQIL